eukprot:TRINITY_DN19080_c0_g1_i2.p1 TRINITY_DN19080_c0_g1~~TRINITY_DN19080_c0_g1_i2.p1  ORF type:complete len:317 (+),score=47.74 TRINITY_DN19080_c0_g1_i2:67-1017(+)
MGCAESKPKPRGSTKPEKKQKKNIKNKSKKGPPATESSTSVSYDWFNKSDDGDNSLPSKDEIEDDNQSVSSELMLAVENGDADAVEELLTKGVSPNGVSHGTTALHKAAIRIEDTTQEIITLLIKHGANANQPDSSGARPLHAAARQRNAEAVRALLLTSPRRGARRKHADPMAKNNKDETPIHIAARTDNSMTLLKLVNSCPNPVDAITATTTEGDTAIHLAARHGRLNPLTTLIELHQFYNLSLDPVNQETYTPIQEAALNGHTAVVRLLREQGAHYDEVAREAYQKYREMFQVIDSPRSPRGNPRPDPRRAQA